MGEDFWQIQLECEQRGRSWESKWAKHASGCRNVRLYFSFKGCSISECDFALLFSMLTKTIKKPPFDKGKEHFSPMEEVCGSNPTGLAFEI